MQNTLAIQSTVLPDKQLTYPEWISHHREENKLIIGSPIFYPNIMITNALERMIPKVRTIQIK